MNRSLLDPMAAKHSASRRIHVQAAPSYLTEAGTPDDRALCGQRGGHLTDLTGTKLSESVPNMKCVGWNWNAAIDPDRIRSKIDE
jgi:hypothetical protein